LSAGFLFSGRPRTFFKRGEDSLMLLTDYLKPDRIKTGFAAADKQAALELLCRFFEEKHNLDFSEVLRVVREREALGSTGLGGGVALPHGKSARAAKTALVMALSPDGIDFDGLDGRPAHIFVLMLTPKDGEGSERLSILARLGALFKAAGAVEKLSGASSPEEVFAYLSARGQ
jgi:PTS system nitrogen regulatory IIA component